MSFATRPPLLQSVQALRGVAALLVVVFHLVAFEVEGKALFGSVFLLERGSAGVDMFFVISGFVMVWVTQSKAGARPHGVGRFLYSRASRIYPLWWVYAGIMALWVWRDAGMVEPGHLLRSFALLPQAGAPVLEVGWTLIHEMYFYAAFAGLLCLPRARLAEGLLAWALAVAMCALVLSAPPLAGNVVELATSPLTLEFLMGAGLALLLERGRVVSVRTAWVELGAGLILLVLAMGFAPEAWFAVYPNMAKVMLFGVPCALVVDGCVGLERAGGWANGVWSWMGTRLGDASYSLYLSHLFVLSAGGKAFALAASATGLAVFDLASGAPVPRLLFAVAGVVACVVVADASYTWLEKPMARSLRRFRPAAGKVAGTSGLPIG